MAVPELAEDQEHSDRRRLALRRAAHWHQRLGARRSVHTRRPGRRMLVVVADLRDEGTPRNDAAQRPGQVTLRWATGPKPATCEPLRLAQARCRGPIRGVTMSVAAWSPGRWRCGFRRSDGSPAFIVVDQLGHEATVTAHRRVPCRRSCVMDRAPSVTSSPQPGPWFYVR